MISIDLFGLIALDKISSHDTLLSLTATSEEYSLQSKPILQTATLEENCPEEQLLKHFPLRHIGMCLVLISVALS